MPSVAPSGSLGWSGRLYDAAAERVREARRSHSYVLAVVAVLLIVRIVAFLWLTMLRANNVSEEVPILRLMVTLSGALSIVLDGVLFITLVFLFENIRRTEAEAARTQTFMDTIYRRGL